jgi:hypothetical protein
MPDAGTPRAGSLFSLPRPAHEVKIAEFCSAVHPGFLALVEMIA